MKHLALAILLVALSILFGTLSCASAQAMPRPLDDLFGWLGGVLLFVGCGLMSVGFAALAYVEADAWWAGRKHKR